MKKFVLKQMGSSADKKVYQIPYQEVLNQAQFEAVMHQYGPALIIAGAGTGKTRTIIYRLARLIEDGTPPDQVLLLTFTRKAAQEMLHRASHILDERCQRVRGGTFHTYCSQILHRFASEIGFPSNFSIIDSSDAQDVLALLRTELGFHKSKTRFPQKSTLYSMFSGSVNRRLELDVLIDKDYPQFRELIAELFQLQKAYTLYKNDHFLMDFDDLLLKTHQLLDSNEEIRTIVAAENRFVMVDEYQDTNSIQASLVKQFCSVHNNVMVVGDDAQSIYAFRGADHKNIMNFPELFTCQNIITLQENYRSSAEILQVANTLLSQSKEKFEKQLISKKGSGDLPALVKAGSDRDQSRFIAQMILHLREQELPLNDIAVLFRNGRDAFDLEVELKRLNLPYVKYGGQKFTEAAHIKDVMAVVRVLVNPDDAIAWNRVLLLLEGIGPKTAKELIAWLRKEQNPYELGNAAGVVSEKFKKEIHRLSSMLVDLKKNAYTTAEALKHIISWYDPILKRLHDDAPKREKDLESFIGISHSYGSLAQMMEELALEPIEATAIETEGAKPDESPLVLSTIHSAKGLEWKHVFIIQCLDGIIPSGYSLESDDNLDEELRLMYVAVTRASDMLYISYPVVHQAAYGDYFTNPSRFIKEMDSKVLEPWILVEESASDQKQLNA